MSVRVASSALIPGSLIVGGAGHGNLAEDIPDGGYLYNDLDLPTDNGKEVRGEITTLPVSGTLTAYEDSSFTFAANDGAYYFEYQLYVDGVATGSPARVDLVIGGVTVESAEASVEMTTHTASVSADTNVTVNATATTAEIASLQAAVVAETNISAQAGAISATAHTAEVLAPVVVSATHIGVSVLAYRARVNDGTNAGGQMCIRDCIIDCITEVLIA